VNRVRVFSFSAHEGRSSNSAGTQNNPMTVANNRE
jgi:hypothetical protein